MNITVRYFFIVCCLLSIKGILGQDVNAEKGSFGVDEERKIIVWHAKNIDSILAKNPTFISLGFDKRYVIEAETKLVPSEPLALKFKEESYTLYLTDLPIVHLNIKGTLKDNSRIPGYFTYFDEEKFIESVIGIRYRGNLSLTFPKKSYDLAFKSDSTPSASKDVQFKNLRNDDDWILDGLFNEPLRLRSTLASKLWLSMYSPNYLDSAPKAKSGFDSNYVEVFKKGAYLGVYALSESVDRKLLALKRNEEKNINGELFKAFSYEGAPEFKKAPTYDNSFPHWGGFEMKYPVLDYKSHWEDIATLVGLVVNEKDDKLFAQSIEKHIDIDNAIDYFLFVNLVRATDNLGKNYYIARYDTEKPYFFVPWDLDGTLGVIQEGKRIPTTNDILSNGLFERLLKVNPDGYKEKLKQRWGNLREAEFAESKLLDDLEKTFTKMKSEKIYERERMLWPSAHTLEEDFQYLNSWLSDRLQYLDEYVNQL